ncbi:hypothetical protein AC477_03155 [miscellaneous Crenarchaeota group-1 archaeon SG8-32-1]|uniref:Uncharacterized protein n=1 Tax=miscellaneous Crenarchaeota group-1 archaeon SG8-32-1 TaxID=1685124 RepID=A0A0M0BVB2_9ARCH|nr:MAG: hypothetical protein AC477_03155 [miscellaneous Crenarchaeota group-1 archaeon SG8-32-1]
MTADSPYRDFISLDHSIKNREEKKLRFSKCPNCGRVTPYRLSSLKGKSLICKECKKPISFTRL